MTRGRGIGALAVACVVVLAQPARADRYEATLELRPRAALGRLVETGAGDADVTATALGGGLDLAAAWGVHNALDVGVLVGGTGFAQATHDGSFPVQGNPQNGDLERTTREGHVLGTATLRAGVGVVGTLTFGLGPGIRLRSDRVLRVPLNASDPDGANVAVTPDDAAGGASFDVVAVLRVGIDVRLNRRWSVGLAASAWHHQGIGAPAVQHVDAGLVVAYRWYPLW